MSREESLTAVLTAAEQLLRAANWPAARGLPAVTVPIGVLAQLAGAVASVVDLESAASDAENAAATRQTLALDALKATFQGYGGRYWCKNPGCWRQNDTAGAYCYSCSEMATAERVRVVRRDPVFRGESDG